MGVVRSTSGSTPADLVEAIDAALLRDLAGIAGIAEPVVSPIDLAEIQLSVGCADDGRPCLESIARAAGVGALLVRALSADDQGAVRLELRYFDSGSRDEPRAVSTQVPAEQSGALVDAVPGLVRELFGIPEVAAPAERTEGEPRALGEPEPQFAASSSRAQAGSSVVPWILMGAGAAALTTGVIVGAIASDDFQAWKSRPLRTDADAQQANEDFDDIEARAIGADIAMVGGGVVLGLGVTLLALELGADDTTENEPASLSLEPRGDGALLRFRSAFSEVW